MLLSVRNDSAASRRPGKSRSSFFTDSRALSVILTTSFAILSLKAWEIGAFNKNVMGGFQLPGIPVNIDHAQASIFGIAHLPLPTGPIVHTAGQPPNMLTLHVCI